MSELRSVPSLDDLAAHPELAAGLPAEAARTLYVRVASLQAALSVALTQSTPATSTTPAASALVSVKEAAKGIGVAPSWLAEQARRGAFRSYKRGHYRRYDAREVVEDFKALTHAEQLPIHRVYDRRRATQGAQAARAHSGRTSRPDRHHG